MSQENMEIVRSLFSSFEQRGPEGVIDALSPDIEWDVRADLPDSRTYRGHDGMRELFATFEDALDEQWYSPQEFICEGNLVVVPLRWGGRGKQSGVTVEEGRETWVFTVRDGFVSRVREYATKEAALEATGLNRSMNHTPKLRYVDPHKQRGRLYLAVCRFSATRAGAWLSTNIAWKIDPHLLKLTRGRFSTAAPLAAALLESRGARTGQTRRNATLYFHDGDRVTIIASLRGWPKNPAWYHNVRKHPDVVFGGLPFRAEIVEDETQRQRLWELADRVYPQYASFREQAGKAGRAIPIIQLVPR